MSSVAVAVLTQPGAAADQLREALGTAGADVVWEGPPDQLDPGSLPGNVVVVNLDPDTEDQLPLIEELLVDGTVRVVFNDATVSSGLSGWDLQRWARHLAAKVLDSATSAELPDAPPGAEPLAVPMREAAAESVLEDTPISLRVPGQEYIEDVISAEIGEPPLPYQERSQASAATAVEAVAEPARAPDPSAAPEPAVDVPPPAGGGWTLEAMEEATAEVPPSPTPGDDPSMSAPQAPSDAAAVQSSADDDIHLGGFTLEPMVESEDAEGPGPASAEDAARGDALVFTDDIDLITEPGAESAVADGPVTEPSESTFGFGELSLEPIELPEDDGAAAEPPRAPQARSAPPAPAAESAPVVDSGLVLDAADGTGDSPSASTESGGTEPKQLWLLVGALGAAEAIAQFLNALPGKVSAAFLVVTHFERGTAETLARSLAASGKWRAHVAGQGDGARARAGDVLVAEEGHAVSMARDGSVESTALDTPSGVIDRCARAAADSFGMDAGVIVFSGSSRDGFEGSLYLAQRGGVVWAQDPATCVAGAMAEAVRSRGLATFLGSPRALAEHYLREFC